MDEVVSPLSEGALVLDQRFKIVRLLGEGGMGHVYLAEQVSLGRQVAIKVLRHDLTLTAGFAERFRREALLLSSVEHPAVVRVIDYGTHDDAPCLVMEFVEGETLETVLTREAPLSVARVERLLTQLSQGLAMIHSKGIIHRDLKPENVILALTPDGETQARLLDFGIARLANPDADNAMTQVGMVLGTPEYLAPEQAMGQPLDARSDLYSLGVMLFRALSGRHPFVGPSAREFIAQHIHETPPRLLDLAPHLSAFPSMVAAVESCLEKEPARRPQSATGLYTLATAKTFTLSTPIELGSNGQPILHRRSRKVWVALGVGAIVLGLTGLFLSYWLQPARVARRLIDSNRGSEALQVLDDMGPDAELWPMQQLRATALHQVGRHDEELKVLSSPPENPTFEPLALEALADDYGHGESARLRKLLNSYPKAEVLPTFQRLAKADQSIAQWGALRFVDLEYAGQGVPLLELYVGALESKDCSVRRIAAKRLIDFRSQDAVPALEKLKALPRKKGEEECGQLAAEQALQRLAKE